MRATLLDWLPADMTDQVVLDAGCGTGAFAIEAAQRGAYVVAIDVAGSLVDVARRRASDVPMSGSIDFRVGDMLGDAPAEVDHVVAMDSLIHYNADDVRDIVANFASRSRRSVLFTSAPWTPALATMHLAGRLIPHSDHRAPAIEPIRIEKLMANLDSHLGRSWSASGTERVKSGFYISQAIGFQRQC